MSYRFMRVIVFYDLPTLSSRERSEHHRFRKFLRREGFIMMQESVYSKITLNAGAANLLKNRIKKNVPKIGLVQLMTITEKQYADIEYLVGNPNCNTDTLNSTSRLVVF